ncbi:MAG: hypothetical protein ACI4RF_01590 [Eubacterium sp.]
MKKEVKAVIAVVLAVWFFLMGFEIGGYHEKKSINSETTVTVPVINTTDNVVTTVPTSQAETTTAVSVETTAASQTTSGSNETTKADNDNTTKETKSAQEDLSTLTKAQIVERVATALNGAKAEKEMTATKKEIVTINVTECSVQQAVSMINSVINRLAGEETVTYQFTNGQAVGIDADGKEADDGAVVTPNEVIPPKTKSFELPEAGVKDATATKDGTNTVYTIYLNPEDTTYTSPVPQYHSNAYGYLDLTSLDISGVSFTDANMHYPNTVITATVNEDGKLVNIHFLMPMTGDGSAKISIISGSAKFEGSDDETWDFSY